MALLDDSLLHDYARANGLRFAWRTWREGRHWHASIECWRGGQRVGGTGTSTIEGEQAALDHAIRDLTVPLPERVAHPVNLWSPQTEGHGPKDGPGG